MTKSVWSLNFYLRNLEILMYEDTICLHLFLMWRGGFPIRMPSSPSTVHKLQAATQTHDFIRNTLTCAARMIQDKSNLASSKSLKQPSKFSSCWMWKMGLFLKVSGFRIQERKGSQQHNFLWMHTIHTSNPVHNMWKLIQEYDNN